MTNTSNYWDKRALKRVSEADKLSDAYINRVKKLYNQAYRNINTEIAKVYANYSKDTGIDVQTLKTLLSAKETDKVWKELERQGLTQYVKNNYKSRISRLEQIQAQIYGKAKMIYPKEELEHEMCYKGVINNSYYKAIYDTQIGTGYDFGFSKIDNNLIKTLLNEKWSGKNYSQRIWGNTDILAESVSQIVGGALLSGQSISKTSKQIRDRFNVGKYYAERLVRTETNHFNNEADAMAYEEMGIDKYVFVATLDNRTSEKCQEHDNKVYNYKDKKTGVNFPPLHPNCRSTTRGYLDEEQEKNLKRRARNPITGKTEVIDNISYKEWLNKNVAQYGQDTIDKSYKMAKNKTKDRELFHKYKQILGKDVKSFENFIEIKYNNGWSELQHKYRLKTHYDKAILNGDVDVLVDFNSYFAMDKRISDNLHAIDVNGTTIQNHSYHFIDRVFGSVEQKRNGVNIEEIENTLRTSNKFKNGIKSFKVYGENSIISINPETGTLIQVNPY